MGVSEKFGLIIKKTGNMFISELIGNLGYFQSTHWGIFKLGHFCAEFGRFLSPHYIN